MHLPVWQGRTKVGIKEMNEVYRSEVYRFVFIKFVVGVFKVES
jgi:hypothetical protein